MSESSNIGESQPQRPWASPRIVPVKGIVQPRVTPPFGKPVRHTNKLDYILNHVLKEASKHKHVWPFQKPVDAVTLCIPLYHEKITRAMDLKTIETRLRNVYYTCAQECIDDIETVFNNCYVFNGKEDDVTIMAQNVHEVIKTALEKGPREEVDAEVTWGKNRKKAKTSAATTSSAARRDTRGPSEVPSEAGSEASARGGGGGKSAKKPGKRKAAGEEGGDDGASSDTKTTETPRVKREVTTTRPVVPQPVLPALKPCGKLLAELSHKKHTEVNWPFLKPVDVKLFGLVDYHTIIKHPMDLATMKTKLDQGQYKDPSEFEADIRLMLANCFLYNPPGDAVHVCGKKFEEFFNKKWSDLMDASTHSRASSVAPSGPTATVSATPKAPRALKEPKKEPKSVEFAAAATSTGSKSEDMMQFKNVLALVAEREEKLRVERETLALWKERVLNAQHRREENPNEPFPYKLLTDTRAFCQGPLGGVTAAQNSSKNGRGGHAIHKPYDFDSDDDESHRPMSYEEKRLLSMSINKLEAAQLSTIVTVIQRRENSTLGHKPPDQEIEIDFEALGDVCLREMEAYITSVLGPLKPTGGDLPKQYRSDRSPTAELKNASLMASSHSMNDSTMGERGGKDKKKKSSFNMSESSDDETSNSRKRRKKAQRAASSDSDSSSSSDDDSDDDRAKNIPRKSGQPPSAAWNHQTAPPPPRIAGMGGQPPMSRVPPPPSASSGSASASAAAAAPAGPSGKSSTFHQSSSSSRIATKPPTSSSKPQAQKKEVGKSILDTLLPDSFGASSSSASAPQQALPDQSDSNVLPGMIVENGENEAERIHRMRMEAKRAREREDENAVTLTTQMEMMSQFEYNNMY